MFRTTTTIAYSFFAALVAATLSFSILPGSAANACQPEPDVPQSAEGILYDGPIDELRAKDDGDERDERDDEFHLIGSHLRWDFSEVLEDCHKLAGKAVIVRGVMDNEGRIIARSITEKEGGIVKTVTGTLLEPGIGFDSGAPGWRLRTADGSEWEFEPTAGMDMQELVGRQVTVTARLGITNAFYEDSGHRIEPAWKATKIEEVKDADDDDDSDDSDG